MAQVLDFDGVDDVVDHLIGLCSSTATWTLLALVKFDAGVGWQSLLSMDIVSTGSEVALGRRGTSGEIWASRGGGAGGHSDAIPISSTDGWAIVAITKSASGNQPITMHKCVLSTGTWTHTAAESLGNVSAQGLMRFGAIDNADFFKGLAALYAKWNVGLTNLQLESLVTNFTRDDWLALSPAGLWDAEDSFETDHTGGGATGTVSGTTVNTTDLPPNWESWAGGAEGVTGTADSTLSALTQDAAGNLTVDGTADSALAALTQDAAAEASVDGTAASTLAALTADAAGGVSVDGSAASTLSALTQAAAGDLTVDGTAASELAALTQDADGTVEVDGVAGTVAQELPALEQAASGSALVQGSAASTLPGFSQSADGAVLVTGRADGTLGALTTEAEGTLTVDGTAASALPALDQAATGALPVSGAIDSTLPALVAELEGELGSSIVTIELTAAARRNLALSAGANSLSVTATHAHNLNLEAEIA